MSDESLVMRLVEEALASDLTPDAVCADHPECLAQVREHLHRCQTLDAELAAMFPPSAHQVPAHALSIPAELPRIAGYEVECVLGRGGMGIVYQARHLKLNRRVALKMVLAGNFSSQVDRIRFLREAEAIAALKHPNIVQIYDLGDVESRPFFTMELMEGGSLAQKLGGTPQPAKSAALLVASLASAMQFAHEKGIIHRDLKPANILLTEMGTTKISDFGLARRIEDDSLMTFHGARVGTPSYMAPEQAAGKPEFIGPATDIYALGAILYEMLTGRPPFRAETAAETERQIIAEEPAPPARLNSKIPADLQTICLKALEKQPQRRYATAADLAADLERFLRGEPILARPVSLLERGWRWSLRNQSTAIAMASLFLLLLLSVLGSLWAATHFRSLATVKTQLAATNEAKRQEAEAAVVREAALRAQAEKLSQEMRHGIYLTEMNLAGQSAQLPNGLGRTSQLLKGWEHSHPDLRQWEWYYLNALCHRDLQRYRVAVRGMFRIAWDPSGKRLASPSDRSVCIWTPNSHHAPLRLQGHTREVVAVAWSTDGQQLASVSLDSTLRIWDPKTGELLHMFRGEEEDLISIAWSPDGNRIAAGSEKNLIQLWDVATGDRKILRGHAGPVCSLAWHPTGNLLASASRDSHLKIWDLETLSELRTLDTHRNWVNQVAWSPDGTRLASVSNDHTAKIWDSADFRELLTLQKHSLGVTGVSWHPEGKRLATSSDDQTIKVFETTNGRELFDIRGHAAPLTAVAWSSSGDRIASASFDGTLRIWDATASAESLLPQELPAAIRSIAWNPQEPKLMAVGCADGFVLIRDSLERQIVQRFRASEKAVHCVAWHPTGKRLTTGGEDAVVRIWDVDSEQAIAELVGHEGDVFAVDWDPSGARLVSSGSDKLIRIWQPATHKALVLAGHQEDVRSVSWSPDGSKIASASGDGTAKIWDAEKGRELLSYAGHWGQVLTIAWHRDGRTLASSGHDGTVQIWDSISGERSKVLAGHNAHVLCVEWSPDGSRVASAANNGTVKIWDAASSREAMTLAKVPSLINSLAWSRDGQSLTTGSEDKLLQLYDAANGYIAARAKQLLPELDRRLAATNASAADVLLRAETLAFDRQWDSAARDVRRYLEEVKQPWLLFDGQVAGPFQLDKTTGTDANSDVVLASATMTEPEATQSGQPLWRLATDSKHGFLDLSELCENRNHVSAYVWFPIFSLQKRPITILWGSDDGAQLWLNSQPIAEWRETRSAVPDNNTVDVDLQPGWNSLVMQVQNETGNHALYLRLTDRSAN